MQIALDKFEEYKEEVLNQMVLQGATENDLQLLKEETIINAIRKNRSPKDVAWAILQ